nr:immunoglobulin heavy chain junction region [Mus musculus]MBK4186026.1 immunoglobulin heavy chain junction region [Mus musculus]
CARGGYDDIDYW